MKTIAIFLCLALVLLATTSIKAKCARRVVAYYTSTSTVPLREWQARMVTHINYAFLYLWPNGTLHITDPQTDQQKARESIRLLQYAQTHYNPDLKLLFSIGGWGEYSDSFSRVAASAALTQEFIRSALALLDEHNFDGIDLDWEFPVTGGADGWAEPYARADDAENQNKFIQEIRRKFSVAEVNERKKLLLTMAAPGAMCNLVTGYDLGRIAPHLDWFNIMTYDYYTTWDMPKGSLTGPVAPLYPGGVPHSANYSADKSVDGTMRYYACQMQAAFSEQLLDKLVLGLPFYTRYWNNVDSAVQLVPGNNLWRTAKPNATGHITGDLLSYAETRRRKWLESAEFDEKTRAPFVWLPNEKILASFQNSQSTRERTQYAVDHALGGVMFWAMDLDDESLYATNGTLLQAIWSTNVCVAANANAEPSQNYSCGQNNTVTKLISKQEADQIYGRCQN